MTTLSCLLIQQKLIEHLLCFGLHLRPWTYGGEQDGPRLGPHGMILQFSRAVEEESGTRRACKQAGLCEGVRAGVPEEVTLTLGSKKQTQKLAGAREE